MRIWTRVTSSSSLVQALILIILMIRKQNSDIARTCFLRMDALIFYKHKQTKELARFLSKPIPLNNSLEMVYIRAIDAMPLVSPRQSSSSFMWGGRCRRGPRVFLTMNDYVLRNMLHGTWSEEQNKERRKCGAPVPLALGRARRVSRSGYRGGATSRSPAPDLTHSSPSR